MKISDLKNPAAAAKAINDFKRKYSAKTCLSPTKGDCAGGIVAAHTLSAQAMLRPISRDGHVYTVVANLFKRDGNSPIEFKLRGISDTSVFNGFCSFHDKQLFSPIEDKPFTCSPEQIFLYAFRAVAKESYLKRKQAESSLSLDDFREIHGIPKDHRIEFSEEMILHKAASLRGAEEIERLKEKMDRYYCASDWRRLVTTVILFSKRPNLVCNSVFSPAFDFRGNYLQEYGDWEQDLDFIMITVAPYATGGFALLSYLDTSKSASRTLIDSLIKRPNLTTSVIWLVLGQVENFALSPDWYESLSNGTRNKLMAHFLSNANSFDPTVNTLKECPEFIDEWSNCSVFQI